MTRRGWLVAERWYPDGGSRFNEIPISPRFEKRNDAVAESANHKPEHGGEIFVVPFEPEVRIPRRLRSGARQTRPRN
jgi:hypothetical protein